LIQEKLQQSVRPFKPTTAKVKILKRSKRKIKRSKRIIWNMLQLRWLGTCLLSQDPGFDNKSLNEKFIAGDVALQQLYFRVSSFSPINHHLTIVLYSYITTQKWLITLIRNLNSYNMHQ
jgi:hypothetical protein